jgi:murein DD-endopeptidase MepM/ murein hydrolase activator NlpD
MTRRRSTTLWIAGMTLAVLCPSAAGQERRQSGRIVAFGDDAPPPAAQPEAAPKPAAPTAEVVYGAVVPPPPQVAVSKPRAGSRPGETGGFQARPAAASRLAVNSPFGYRSDPLTGLVRMHTGVDLRADYGASVGASMSGRVWFAGARSGYGNLVVVDHGAGVATFYAHLSSIVVSIGQEIAAGQLVGYVGTTGRSTGPHLHYEVRANGHPVDPDSAISLVGDELVVQGRAFGRSGTWDGPVELPRAPGGTSIAVNLAGPEGQSLVADLD